MLDLWSSKRARRSAKTLAHGVYALAWTGLALVCVAPAPVQAADDCRLEVIQPPSLVSISYDPFGPVPAPAQLTMVVRNPEAVACVQTLTLLSSDGSPASAVAFAMGQLTLELRSTVPELRQQSGRGLFALELGPGETLALSWDAFIITDGLLPAGLYVRDMVFAMGATPTEAAAIRTPLAFEVRSLPHAQLNLAGNRGSFGEGPSVGVIDFGIAETGTFRHLFVQARTNTAAVITVVSRNKGGLRLDDATDDVDQIPYTVTLDGTLLDLRRTTRLPVDPSPGFAGEALEMKLTLGEINGARAGHYSDELTIEITSI